MFSSFLLFYFCVLMGCSLFGVVLCKVSMMWVWKLCGFWLCLVMGLCRVRLVIMLWLMKCFCMNLCISFSCCDVFSLCGRVMLNLWVSWVFLWVFMCFIVVYSNFLFLSYEVVFIGSMILVWVMLFWWL